MDKAQNRGKFSEMGPEWSPGPEKKALSFQPCLAVDCARSRGQEGPPCNGQFRPKLAIRAAGGGLNFSTAQ